MIPQPPHDIESFVVGGPESFPWLFVLGVLVLLLAVVIAGYFLLRRWRSLRNKATDVTRDLSLPDAAARRKKLLSEYIKLINSEASTEQRIRLVWDVLRFCFEALEGDSEVYVLYGGEDWARFIGHAKSKILVQNSPKLVDLMGWCEKGLFHGIQQDRDDWEGDARLMTELLREVEVWGVDSSARDSRGER